MTNNIIFEQIKPIVFWITYSRAKIETFQRCSGCKYVYYCKPACQKSSWPQHRDECKYLKAVAPKVPTDTVRLMVRIILKLQVNYNNERITPNIKYEIILLVDKLTRISRSTNPRQNNVMCGDMVQNNHKSTLNYLNGI